VRFRAPLQLRWLIPEALNTPIEMVERTFEAQIEVCVVAMFYPETKNDNSGEPLTCNVLDDAVLGQSSV
jgi:hypothetical protein